MSKRKYKSKIDALLALYSCDRSRKIHNNFNRHEVRIYEYKSNYYLTSKNKNECIKFI